MNQSTPSPEDHAKSPGLRQAEQDLYNSQMGLEESVDRVVKKIKGTLSDLTSRGQGVTDSLMSVVNENAKRSLTPWALAFVSGIVTGLLLGRRNPTEETKAP